MVLTAVTALNKNNHNSWKNIWNDDYSRMMVISMASFLNDTTYLSPHYPRKEKGSFLHKHKESHIPKSIKDPKH